MTANSNGERSSRRMVLRRDHIAGGAFIAAGVLVFALSGDLPFGTLASPGAGMMPKLALILMIGFGVILVVRARESPPIAEIAWGDFSHAATVAIISAAAIALYTKIGFFLSISLLLFVLIYFVERKNIWRSAAVSIGVTGAAYVLFSNLLKSPLPPFALGL
jgi:putative tricarboxylic transport membrane protein